MTQLGDFWCKNRKPNSLDCERGLECPRAWDECDSFRPDGEAILDEIIEDWLNRAQKGDGLSNASAKRLQVALIEARAEW